MCSLMEKDALIEKVAETMALISQNREKVLTNQQDSEELGKLGNKIYSSKPELLDFWEIIKKCNEIQEKYRFNKEFQEIWQDLLRKSPQAQPQDKPQGFVLGGQPAAGKSRLIEIIANDLGANLLIINGDEFRRYHPRFSEIQAEYGDDAPKHTAIFSAQMTELVLTRALKERFNLAIEGTFRTAEIPLKTISLMKEQGYKVSVYIQTCPKQLSWQNCLERYEAMKKAGLSPRAVAQAHHDLVCEKLAENADKVLQSENLDEFKVFNHNGLIFDSKVNKGLPSQIINQELN